MSGFVLDASVTMAWCFGAQADDYCQRVLAALEDNRAKTPDIWILEILNSQIVAERKRRMREEESESFLDRLWHLPIDVEAPPSRSQWSKEVLWLARTNHLSSYDAAYLDLAKRKGLPLATRDTALHRASTRVGIPLFLDGSHG